jgi:hypothetical protein
MAACECVAFQVEVQSMEMYSNALVADHMSMLLNIRLL